MSNKRDLPKWLVPVLMVVFGVLVVVALLGPAREDRVSRPELPVQPLQKRNVEPVVEPPELMLPAQPEAEEIRLPRLQSGLALILDDVGYDLSSLQRILDLSIPVAIAIIPDAPFATESATLAHEQGQVVMLHLPMEPTSEKYRRKMGPYFLHERMSRDELRETFLRGLNAVPYVEGVNNHMGSFLTERVDSMRWVMQLCREKELFFVDSKTSHKSVAADTAQLMDVPWASRQIFLDHDLAPEAMQAAWQKAERCLERGYRCIVIGHPHEETVSFLERQFSSKDTSELTPVVQLLRGGDLMQETQAIEAAVR